MTSKIISITAVGTRGDAKGQVFTAKRDRDRAYVLNRKVSAPSEGNRTNRAVNKVRVDSLDEAYELLSTDQYLINLTGPGGKRALREFAKVVVASH
ncbi:MAG: hypothetical protein CME38_00470 [Haliea sp.]|nr:hypothetical protein [Haliea sp.]|tara:strand:+ start:4287 stop:4574 length:288 start_codon:yes stop_codon:yes gene_type:complete